MQAAPFTPPAVVRTHPAVTALADAAHAEAWPAATHLVLVTCRDGASFRYTMVAACPVDVAAAAALAYSEERGECMVSVCVRRHSDNPADRPIWRFTVTVDDCGIPSIDPA